MPKFKVHVQQYVERVATIIVEAENSEDAADSAARILKYNTRKRIRWTEGDDAERAEVYAVANMKNEIVWER